NAIGDKMGEVRWFQLNADGSWSTNDTQLASTGVYSQRELGAHLGMSGDTLVLSDGLISFQVYDRKPDGWQRSGTLTPPYRIDSAAFVGRLLVVGSYLAGIGPGNVSFSAATAFTRNDDGSWSGPVVIGQQPETSSLGFGRLVATNGTSVIVGGSVRDGNN